MYQNSIYQTHTDFQQNNPCALQGIIDSTGTETRQIFSRMFVMAKIFKTLFTKFAITDIREKPADFFVAQNRSPK